MFSVQRPSLTCTVVRMGLATLLRKTACLAGLTVALVFLLFQVQDGTGITLRPSKLDSKPTISLDSQQHVANKRGSATVGHYKYSLAGATESTRDVSLLEERAQHGVNTQETNQRRTTFQRLVNRLRRRERDGAVSGFAADSPSRPRLSVRQRLAQLLRRAKSFFTHGIRRYYSQGRNRLRSWWAQRRRSGLVFEKADSGCVIGKRILAHMREQIRQPQALESSQRLDGILTAAAWPPDVPAKFVSLTTGETRTLVRGAPLGSGGFAAVYQVTDVETNEELAVKVIISEKKPTDETMRDLERESFCYKNFSLAKTAKDAQENWRFMVASDVVTLEGQPATTEVVIGSATKWVPNYFLLMMRAETDMSKVISWLFGDASVNNSELGLVVRMHLSSQAIRLVANVQAQGIVHTDIKPPNFLLLKDGRLFLGDFGTYKTNNSVGPAIGTPGYEPPEQPFHSYGVTYTFATDAWQLGITLYCIWCKESPTPADGIWDYLHFADCSSTPELVQDLIRNLLNREPQKRMLPLQALKTAAFNEMDSVVKRAAQNFEQQEHLQTE
ncbi:rhoptry protein ROP18 [Toxoplasma gondii VEG]|uniref:Rhoptry protein ROP18 n=6 Tax=Toxoplasma gondii TaxID=5811 RepID=V4ZDA0_TOXGV|nr:rhoptry kinase family protein [Toxoplasma gondii]ESS33238.1 rhoptry protein ROP18 [Toxoplasma gondii VEG]AFO54834.1 rhoptry kinase family protein [Toxoplasma gondii]AFO54835.1 rhoptry kinase family protein [Toxoplasma gondii]AFO54836.1 rhoptry kinase family protein [Toxoplasma gondii]